jgi:hypothetical protein
MDERLSRPERCCRRAEDCCRCPTCPSSPPSAAVAAGPRRARTGPAEPEPRTLEMNTVQVLAVFAGIPLAIMLLIAVAVMGPSRWRRRRVLNSRRALIGPAAVPAGITRRDHPCWVLVDSVESANDFDVHHDRPEQEAIAATRRLDDACWTLRCANCGTEIRDQGNDIHFLTLQQAAAFAWMRGWTISASRVRCPRCSTRLGAPVPYGEGNAIDGP